MMKIVQPLNNNVVMAYDRRQGEIVVVGTGVGFHAKKGDLVDEKKIQKIFVAGQNKKLMELIGAGSAGISGVDGGDLREGERSLRRLSTGSGDAGADGSHPFRRAETQGRHGVR